MPVTAPPRSTETHDDRDLEQRVAELEARLAENWTDMDLLASYTSGREELDALLARWEVLFAAAQVEPGEDGAVVTSGPP